MFDIDVFIVTLKFIVLAIYGTAGFISFIFTFFHEYYQRMNELLNAELFSVKIINPMEQNIYFLDIWIMENKKTIGPILTVLSLYNINSLFGTINLLR